MKLCSSEADFRPVFGRVLHVSANHLFDIEECWYKDQIGLFPTHHDDNGWCGCSSNYGVYCGYYGEYGDCVSYTIGLLWGDWRVCVIESPRSSLDKRRIFRKSPRPSLPLKKVFRIPPSPFSQRELHRFPQAPFPSGDRGCSWRRYSSARVLVSSAEPVPTRGCR